MRGEGGREAGQFVFPVVAYGCGGNDDRGAGRGLRQQDGDGLHGLAEAHVVREAGPRAPAGQPGQPHEAVDLVIAQFRPQGGRHGGRTRFRRSDAPEQVLPRVVSPDFGPVQQIADGVRRQRVYAAGSVLAFRQPVQPVELLPELPGQGEERAVPEGHETPLRLREAFQHLRHVQHQRFVDPDLPLQREPLPRVAHVHGKPVRRNLRADPELFAFGPFEFGSACSSSSRQSSDLPYPQASTGRCRRVRGAWGSAAPDRGPACVSSVNPVPSGRCGLRCPPAARRRPSPTETRACRADQTGGRAARLPARRPRGAGARRAGAKPPRPRRG